MRKDYIAGRIIGLITFLAGVGLLVFVALIAYNFFTTATVMPEAPANADVPATTRLGQSAITIIVQISLLIVMTVVGSLIASKGIHLFSAAGEIQRIEREERPARGE